MPRITLEIKEVMETEVGETGETIGILAGHLYIK